MSTRTFNRTLRAQWLGSQLRHLREQRKLSLEVAAEMLGRDRSALGRFERAEWPVSRADVEALLNIYGCYHAETRARFLAVAEEIWRTDRWDHNDGEITHADFIDLPWLESRAERISSYHCMVVPGLFQLPAYAELVIRCAEGPDVSEALVRHGLALRLERQKLLARDDRPQIEAVIDEAALRRQIGGPELLRAQLAHLAEVATRPRISIRVLPTSVWLHAGLDGSFWLFRLPAPYPPVAYQENRAGRLFLESPKSEGFQDAYDRVAAVALGPRESAELIAGIGSDLSIGEELS